MSKNIILMFLILSFSFGCGKNNTKIDTVTDIVTEDPATDNTGDILEYDEITTTEDVIVNRYLCESTINGQFVLKYDNDGNNCILAPKVLFTFTPSNGRELVRYNFDPTSVIKNLL